MSEKAPAPTRTLGLGSPGFKSNPHPAYARRRAETPVYRALLPGGQPAGLVTCYDGQLATATERCAREDVSLHGVTIRRGDLVYAVLASANRDGKQFPDPGTLDIARHPNRHLAFGLGVHYCLGAPLARLKGQIAIGALLRRAPRPSLAVAPEALRWRRGLVLRGPEAPPVTFGARPPGS